MEYTGYRGLLVWQRSRRLAIEVYRATAANGIARDWALRDQMRRAAVSVPSNIAEGVERYSNPDSVRFLWYAKGSLAELATQADIAAAIGNLPLETSNALQRECDELGAMLRRLIRARSRKATSNLRPPTSDL